MILWWISVLVPAALVIWLAIWHRDRLAWWEPLLVMGVSISVGFLTKLGIERSMFDDTEYWGDLGVRVEYYEPWESWVSRICTRQVPCGSDSKGHIKYCTQFYDCSYCDDHGPQWILVTREGRSISISQARYGELVRRWRATPRFHDLGRSINHHGFCGKDGDVYLADWDGQPITSEPVTSVHTYENRVQAAHTAFDFPDVTEDEIKKYGLHTYPNLDSYRCPTVLGTDSLDWMYPAERDSLQRLMSHINGDLGKSKELRVWLLFFRDQPELAAHYQEALWKGGNKNELVICVGASRSVRRPLWVKAFSWTPNRRLLVDIREDLMEAGPWTTSSANRVILDNVKGFERRHFKEFSYLTADPPMWGIVLTLALTVLSAIGVSVLVIGNGVE